MLKIGVIAAYVREGSNTEQVARWTLDYANNKNTDGVTYELVSLIDYDLPSLGKTPTEAEGKAIQAWKDAVAQYDGYIFVTPEYNRATPGFFKNALDYLQPEVNNKPVAYAGFGGLSGLAAISGLRVIAAEQQMADVGAMATFSLNTVFENFSVFKPNDYHKPTVDKMLDQLLNWTRALKTIR